MFILRSIELWDQAVSLWQQGAYTALVSVLECFRRIVFSCDTCRQNILE